MCDTGMRNPGTQSGHSHIGKKFASFQNLNVIDENPE
jgi:hypothetical protein